MSLTYQFEKNILGDQVSATPWTLPEVRNNLGGKSSSAIIYFSSFLLCVTSLDRYQVSKHNLYEITKLAILAWEVLYSCTFLKKTIVGNLPPSTLSQLAT